MSPIATRTLNPLPFEHLEPKRFEDLVRQLAYDFRNWRQLEATGRAGSDGGFDARGWEISDQSTQSSVSDEDEIVDDAVSDRLWLIQCKRETRIGPAQMREHLDAIASESRLGLHGLLFVASCNFSLKARNNFRDWCSENSVFEWHIWDRAEIEDLLFQPKNDNLLFAYFGISLQIRKQKIGAAIRRTTTIKRKLNKIIKPEMYRCNPIIVRDISDERYPYYDGAPNFQSSDALWRVYYAEALGINGLRVIYREHRAYLDSEKGHWDLATLENQAEPKFYDNPWHSTTDDVHDTSGYKFWISIPEEKRFTATLSVELPYSEIIEIDEVGDAISKLTTIYVNFVNGQPPFAGGAQWVFKPSKIYADAVTPDFAKHRRIFPEASRDLEWENGWAARNGITLDKEGTEIDLDIPDWVKELDNSVEQDVEPK